MNFVFFFAARAELEEAFDYYETQESGLGDEFAREVYRSIQLIVDHPLAWGRLSRQTRRCRTRRFPYGIIYHIRNKTIVIVAIMHLSRKPNYWKGRR